MIPFETTKEVAGRSLSWRRLGVLAMTVFLCISCSDSSGDDDADDDDATGLCEPGATRSCDCGDGSFGIQTCLADGSQ